MEVKTADPTLLSATLRMQTGENPEHYLIRLMDHYHQQQQMTYLQATWEIMTMTDASWSMLALVKQGKRLPEPMRRVFPAEANPDVTTEALRQSEDFVNIPLTMEQSRANKAIRAYNLAGFYLRKQGLNEATASAMTELAKMLPGPFRVGDAIDKKLYATRAFGKLGIHEGIENQLAKAVLAAHGLAK